jgi:ATP-binding cassette subfamily E protein 1
MTETDEREYVALIEQDEVTDEVRDIAVKYDPLNRSGHEGFHVTENGELHIDDAVVMKEHKLIEKKIPNDAIEIVPLPSEGGTLVHQYGENGFRLYNLPALESGSVVGLLGRNGIGKSTALRIVAGQLKPNLGQTGNRLDWNDIVTSFRGTALQTHFEGLANDEITVGYKQQRVDEVESDADRSVRELLTNRAGDTERLVDEFAVETLLDRSLEELSGGERQRVAIADTLATDADLYLFDEPSSFLDAEQRLDLARKIRECVQEENATAIVVEHDLATLDLLSDSVHVLYGEPGGFGVVSQQLSPRNGSNQFLDGQLVEENVRIRDHSIEFPTPSEHSQERGRVVFEYPALETSFDDFSLSVEPGQIHERDVVGIVGKNALGKTTFARLLAGGIEPNEGRVPEHATVSYKPQHITPDSEGTVRTRLANVADVHSQGFKTQIRDPFELESLYDRSLSDLSGGELQRVGVALCLARDADVYLLDEPSAFLDVERRVSLADGIRRVATRTKQPVLVIDHDVFVIDWVANRLLVFEGISGEHGRANPPKSMREGMNNFLSSVGITFRRDDRTGRPRPNDPGSQLDREQKAQNNYYYTSPGE